ncbi:hypothetical protein [Pseudoalteromonas sp. Ps84H-4]|uniref:hypothetical protein n=1 Tax=Pseudoalteromonas sp. Ps84H-4 TaxID=2954502 RepID=UPI002097FB99|nr:hypothetical protein [Pseudoalteromonas sp. Ps84H-4]MCO7251242.1 hypothetical protein [Pseudoalteromonas sp. Ps84H-4]
MTKQHFILAFLISAMLVGCGKDTKQAPVAAIPTPPPISFVDSEFTRPYKYHNFKVETVSEILGVEPNAVGNIEVETDKHHILYEATDGIITYSEVRMLETTPCSLNESFDPAVMLDAVAVNVANLDPQTRLTHLAVYYDHNEKLKISVACEQDGVPITVRFSNKYYGY